VKGENQHCLTKVVIIVTIVSIIIIIVIIILVIVTSSTAAALPNNAALAGDGLDNKFTQSFQKNSRKEYAFNKCTSNLKKEIKLIFFIK